MKYILKILLFLIICDACKRSDIDVFDIVEEITDYDSVYSDKNDVFNRITDMAILDSVLITKHMNDTYHFSFIDVNGKKIIKRLGKRGRGPGEYLQIGTGFTVCGSKLVFLDAMQKEINYVSISDVIENKIPYHIEKEAYPYTVDFRPRHMDVINHVKVAVGSLKKGTLVCLIQVIIYSVVFSIILLLMKEWKEYIEGVYTKQKLVQMIFRINLLF
nr:hypothetical protein [Odoribacter splanchnicus]